MKRELEPYQMIERSIIKKYRKELWTPFIVAVKRYELVQEGDKIAVCISGGKDSMPVSYTHLMPLPQMLQTITVPRATKASSQLDSQLVMAEGARIRPMEMMMGPVTTGGKNFIMRRMPKVEMSRLTSRYRMPDSATPAQA